MSKKTFKVNGIEVSPLEYLSIAATKDVAFHFSEAGEDINVIKLFNKKTNGFYIDVGAFRPKKYSNTYLLHLLYGWNGINVDASTEAIELFKNDRPNDINIQAAIGDEKREATYYKFKEKTINTISEDNLKRQLDRGKEIIGEEIINVRTLESIFSEYVGEGKEIDLLNVDIEGEDLKALKSNDWNKYRPLMILIEDYSLKSDGIGNSDIYTYLNGVGYKLCSHTFQTSIYVSNEFQQNLSNTPNNTSLERENFYVDSNTIDDRALSLVKAHPEWNRNSKQIKKIKNQLDESIEENLVCKAEIRHLENKNNKDNSLYESRMESFKLELEKMHQQILDITNDKESIERKYNSIIESRSWRILTPFRNMIDFIKYKLGLKRESNTKTAVKVANNEQKATKKKHNKKMRVYILEKKLWGGFSTYALKDLNKIKHSEDSSTQEKCKAAWALMRWTYANGDFKGALDNIDYINQLDPEKKDSLGRIIVKVKCLMQLNKMDEAKSILQQTIDEKGYVADLCLGMANTTKDDNNKLKWINTIFHNTGYAPVIKKNEHEPLTLSNITTVLSKKNQEIPSMNDQIKKVSVIIPAYNAEDMIGITLEGLLAQSWRNIEIVIVDDCSTDNTCDVISSYAEKDKRVKLFKKENNEGAYAARNTALQHVTGDFITIHDSDDWSHPQKIESQVRALINAPDCVAVVSYWSRVLEDMTFMGPWFPKGTYFERNLSSLLFNRSVITKIGGWDEVRVTGDTEFLWRIQSVYGKESVLTHEPNVPLSFSLTSETSLTRSKATHVRTVKFGLRRVYREGANWWHTNSPPSKLYIDPKDHGRKFPAPIIMYHSRPDERNYDVIFVSDFSYEDEYFESTFYSIKGALTILGKKVGIIHWPRYDLTQDEQLSQRIYQLANDENLDIIVPGEEVSSDLVVVGNPLILKYKIDDSPIIKTEKVEVILRKSRESFEKENVTFNTMIANENLRSVFGHEGQWLTSSSLDKEKV
ncbi:glycosyltransferase [Evansella sp. AB-P1]|uniref:glycosyltransferase n=1 Tax=Evansella sp. AB-P1 TaxID=3037653 RepID=UPI00241F774A|nr:glycosyltransferase [Evansella sp. AB-P1]MDG5786699.1 glycosyltransferase [Evansella sp. AB-P1]